MDCLGRIEAIVQSLDVANVIIVGDFNANLAKDKDGKLSIFGENLLNFVSEGQYILTDYNRLPNNSYITVIYPISPISVMHGTLHHDLTIA